MTDSKEFLRRVAIGDPTLRSPRLADDDARVPGTLDDASLAVLHLGASIAMGTEGPVMHQHVSDALDAGYDLDQVVAAFVELIPMIGMERAVAVAPALAMGLGYDVDDEVERLD